MAPEAEMPIARWPCPFPLARMFDPSPPRSHLPSCLRQRPPRFFPRINQTPGRWRRRIRDLLQVWSPRPRWQQPKRVRSSPAAASLSWRPPWSRCSCWQLGSCGALWFTKRRGSRPPRRPQSKRRHRRSRPPCRSFLRPAIAEPTPIRAATPANKSADSAEGRGRAVRSRTTAKINKPREVGELSDRTKNSQSPGANHAPRTGKW